MDRLYGNSPNAPEGPASVHVLVYLATIRSHVYIQGCISRCLSWHRYAAIKVL